MLEFLLHDCFRYCNQYYIFFLLRFLCIFRDHTLFSNKQHGAKSRAQWSLLCCLPFFGDNRDGGDVDQSGIFRLLFLACFVYFNEYMF